MQNSTMPVGARRIETSSRRIATAETVPVASTVISEDGTTIAFERIGQGPAVILVDGALCYRGMGESRELAELLCEHFTVITYDRRGRGGSDDTPPYEVAREVDDIAALVSAAGGSASLWGMSSGAVLALEAAVRLRGITKLALYEAPFIVDGSRPTTETQWVRIDEAVVQGHRGAAVKIFLQAVGVPRIVIAVMQLLPLWRKLKAIAHTLPYDGLLVRDQQQGQPLPARRWGNVSVPTLVMDGGKSPAWMRHGSQALARVLPNAQYQTLPGQTHNLKPRAHAPTLAAFFHTGE